MKFKHLIVFLFVVAFTAFANAEELKFRGTVTAVDSNGNKAGRSFTATDEEGKVKMFHISSLAHLDEGDRVVLTYRDGKKFPLDVIRIKFLQPAK